MVVKFEIVLYTLNFIKIKHTCEIDENLLIRDLLKILMDMEWSPYPISGVFTFIRQDPLFKINLGFQVPMNRPIKEIPNLSFEFENFISLSNGCNNHVPIFEYQHLKVIDDKSLWDTINLFDVEPINQGPIGSWEGWGRGPTIIPKEIDNRPVNLVVIESEGKKVVYNKYALIKWFKTSAESNRQMTLPHNRHEITPLDAIKIVTMMDDGEMTVVSV